MSEELKPCPHCDGTAHVWNSEFGDYVQCAGCGATSRPSHDRAKTIAAWNRRPDLATRTIPMWRDRCEVHSDHQSGMITNQMIQARMQEEIDDLREALAAALFKP